MSEDDASPPRKTEEQELAEAEEMFGPMDAGPVEAVKQVKSESSAILEPPPPPLEKPPPPLEKVQSDSEAPGVKVSKSKKKKKRVDWVKSPQKSFFLDVMKERKCIERIALGGKTRFMIGREKNADIVLRNPSASRKHAALAHGVPPGTKLPSESAKGATLIDLKSNLGTFYSPKYPCRPGTGRVKLEKGSWVILKEGMCFRFGESSRSYIVRDLFGKKSPHNPNYPKDSNDNRLSKDFGIISKVEHDESGGDIGGPRDVANPFAETATFSAPYLKTVNKAVDSKRPLGEPTFSFHKRRKTEMDNIRSEHEKKYRNEILAIKLKEKGQQA